MEEDKVILVYPGFWSGPVFKNGEEALVFVSLRTRSHREFLDEVHKLLQADRRVCEYVLHCFIHTEDGLKKSFIMTDRDLQRVAKIFRTPKIYVSFKRKHHHEINAPTNGNQSFNHHGMVDKTEGNFFCPVPSQGTNVQNGGCHFRPENTAYPFPYWLAPYFHGAGPSSTPYFPAPWMHGAWPGPAPVIDQLGPGSAHVPNQPKPGSAPGINHPNPNAAQPKPNSKPVVNKPNPNSASVVNQPTPGSKLAAHTLMLKRALDACPPCKPTDYENNGSYKRRMLGFKADGYPTDDEEDNGEDDDDDESSS